MPVIEVSTVETAQEGAGTESGEEGETVLVEFQGKVETNVAGLDGLALGELRTASDEPIFIIGTQQLSGRVVVLEKPLAVLESLPAGEDGICRARVVRVITKKYLFESRPLVVLSNKA